MPLHTKELPFEYVTYIKCNYYQILQMWQELVVIVYLGRMATCAQILWVQYQSTIVLCPCYS